MNTNQYVRGFNKGIPFLSLLLFLFSLNMFGYSNTYINKQQGPITGIVASRADGMPLPGASVLIKGTQTAVSADFDGSFTISAPEDAVLVVSYMGYITQEIAVKGQTKFRIVLEENAQKLDEVTIVGYGTLKKQQVTSAVSTVRSKDFNTGSVNDAGQLIQGKVAGLSISLPSGDPTAATQVVLRGTSTILGSNASPLILIDGIPGDFGTVAPQDIESMSVLKDGSAAAMYGTRGTNGVILITTKKASGSNKNKVSYSVNLSTQQISRHLDMLTAQDYKNQIAAGTRNASFDQGSSTDWLDAISQDPISQTHNLTFSGGDHKTNYLATLNMRLLEGIFQKSDNNIFTGRVDINHNMFDDKVKVNLGFLNRSGNYTTTGDGYSFNGYVYRQALLRNPTSPKQYEDGSWDSPSDIANFNYDNPLGRLNESDGQNRNNFSRFNGTVEYYPLEGLKLSALGSYSRYNETRGYAETKQHISNTRSGVNGFASNGTRETQDRLLELTAQYSKKIDKHDFTVLGGYSFQDNFLRDYFMTNNDFQTDIFGYNNIGLGLGFKKGSKYANIGGTTAKTNLISFFGRINYSFDGKYLLQMSLRHEAASQLYKTESPWGTFPAVSAGWRISQEEFMKSLTFVNEFKLRAGYGVTGTPNPDGFGAVALLGYGSYFYYNGEWIRSLVPTQNPNPYLKWEEKHETNLGVDFGFFDNFITGSVDYYQRNIKDLLYDYSVPTPPNLHPTTRANVGELENKGLEFIVNVNAITIENFQWVTSINFSTNESKLVSLSNDLYKASQDYFYTGGTGEPIQTSTHIVEVEQNVGDFYGFKVVDIDETGKWIYETPDGTRKNYDEFSHATEDKQRLGNGLPKAYAGWNNNFKFKNWDLAINMRGAFGYQILNFDRMYLENPTIQYYNRLKSSEDLVYGKAKLTAPLEYNSYYVEDGDFWKIDNITLGYNFKKLGKYINSARIYTSCLNGFLITKYKGIDPEVDRAGLAPGNDYRDKYPTARTFNFGIDVSF
ncbi:TonB-linked SusC/RagA family outer membrane protein [Flavobacterium aquicola]|uniref:TonB-linked SusC/RagA family outer membrane protein n=2 Tax=Flavobacterium aquicola TaxID=1682742 RepID=A0A3E0EL56_9FLAO|nr:TonB-linked SusC/RagA family outer membrane protein [Flavobacterium aquicola]